MKRRIMPMLLAFLMVYSMMPLIAQASEELVRPSDVGAIAGQETFAEAEDSEMSADSETQEDSEISEEDAVASSVDAPILTVWVSGQCIPTTTSIFYPGITSGGMVVHELAVSAQVVNSLNGRPYQGTTVDWLTGSRFAGALFSSTKTNTSGIATAKFHLRTMEPVTITASYGNASKTITVYPVVRARYESPFLITHYFTALEDDYSGSKVSATGVSGTYKSDFLRTVKMEGWGISSNGQGIGYWGGSYHLGEPSSWLNTPLEEGRSIAVDPNYIPLMRSGPIRGTVDIASVGLREADDTGGAITGYHIDVYTGVGKASMPSSSSYNSNVTYIGNNSWSSFRNQPISLEEDMADFTQGFGSIPEVQNTWYSADKTRCAYIKDDLTSRNIEVVIESERGTTNIEMSASIKCIYDIDFIGVDRVGVLGHINPDTDAYLIFDTTTGKLMEEYYGYGFTTKGETIYYVQAPQHFNGISGHRRILSSNGVLLYESSENSSILANIEVIGDEIRFYERDLSTGELSSHVCNVSSAMYSVGNASYYD